MQLVSQQDDTDGTLTMQVTSAAIDASNCAQLRASLQSTMTGQHKIIIDLSKVNFVDSSGLGVLLSCLRQANDAGQQLVLVGLSESVEALFELVRMHRLFKIYETAEDARRELTR